MRMHVCVCVCVCSFVVHKEQTRNRFYLSFVVVVDVVVVVLVVSHRAIRGEAYVSLVVVADSSGGGGDISSISPRLERKSLPELAFTDPLSIRHAPTANQNHVVIARG